MTNFRRQILVNVLMLFDLGILALSYLVAAVRVWHLTAFGSFTSFVSMRVKVLNILLFLGVVYFWHSILATFGLYSSRRLGDRNQEFTDVLKATFLAAIVLVAVASVFQVHMITFPFIVQFFALSSALLILCRVLIREFLAFVRIHGRNLRHVLIVGTNSRAEEFARTIANRPDLGYQLIGFADDEWLGNEEFSKNGNAVVTGLDRFSEFLRERIVDEVVIALPMKSCYSQAARIVGECQEQGVMVHTLNSLFDCQQGRLDAKQLDALHLSTYSTTVCEGWPSVFKRLLDIIASSALLLLLAPLLLIVTLLAKLDSPGPVFFVQERVGMNKRKFRMYKFRTMVINAEKLQLDLEKLNEADGPVFKIKADPRITRLGKYLRKASIDELPQLLNVLKGDMSLVGPRPLPLRDYQGFDEDRLRRRFSVRPGITCLWQVNGRSSTTFRKWMELDMQYIDNWSLWLDLKILAKTVPAVLGGSGAA
jgi:exopolysaccharide biosynthesis polyprenyl glycosylphosphotransferase